MADDATPLEVFIDEVLEGIHRESVRFVLELQLWILRQVSVTAVEEAIVRNGFVNGVPIWLIETVGGVLNIFANFPGRLRTIITTAALKAVASKLQREREDGQVVLTRATVLDGVATLLTAEAASLATLGVTQQWRIVKLIRRLAKGIEGLLPLTGWAGLVEKVVLWLVELLSAVWDFGVKFVAAALLLTLDRKTINRLWPALRQTKVKRPARRKVWTREATNQK